MALKEVLSWNYHTVTKTQINWIQERRATRLLWDNLNKLIKPWKRVCKIKRRKITLNQSAMISGRPKIFLRSRPWLTEVNHQGSMLAWSQLCHKTISHQKSLNLITQLMHSLLRLHWQTSKTLSSTRVSQFQGVCRSVKTWSYLSSIAKILNTSTKGL